MSYNMQSASNMFLCFCFIYFFFNIFVLICNSSCLRRNAAQQKDNESATYSIPTRKYTLYVYFHPYMYIYIQTMSYSLHSILLYTDSIKS